MKVISPALAAHLKADTTTLVTAVKLTRQDGVVQGYTTHDKPLTFDCDGQGLVTYQPQGGYNRSAIASQLSLATDNLELEGLLDDDAITEADLLTGKYDNAELKFMLVNWQDLSQGVLKLRQGYIGQITLHRDTFVAEVRGLMDAYGQVIGELYTPDCRADLGDARCKVVLDPSPWEPTTAYPVGARVVATADAVPLRHFRCTQAGTSGASEPAWDATLNASTGDGGCTWETLLALTVAATVAGVLPATPGEASAHRFTVTPALPEFGAVPEEMLPWFAVGKCTWLTGANAGVQAEMKAWDETTSTVTLFLPPTFPIQAGDTLTLTVGCDKRRQTCIARFANIVNMRGEPYLPGLGKLLDYPSPHSV